MRFQGSGLMRLGIGSIACATMALAAAGCGDDDSSSASTSTGTVAASTTAASKAPAKLSVNIGTYDSTYAPLYIALDKGYFKDAGVTVTVKPAGPSQVPSLLSGQTDVYIGGMSTPYASINQGKQLKFLRTTTGGGTLGFVAGKPSIKSITDCKSFTTFIAGSGSYAWAAAFKKAYNVSDMKIRSVNDFTAIPATLASGRTDCANATYGVFSALLAKGTAHLLVDPRKKNLPNGLGTVPDAGIWTTPANLKSKQAAIAAFLKGYERGEQDMVSADPKATADFLLKNEPGFKSFPEAALVSGVEVTKGFVPADHGMIDEANYNKLVTFLKDGGVTFLDSSNPKFSFSSVVDLAPVKAAVGG